MGAYPNYDLQLDCFYYNGYLLDGISVYDLTEKDKIIIDNACILVDNNWSLRKLSRNCCRSKSQLQRDFKHLKIISYELYKVVERVLHNNKDKYFKR